MEKRQNTVQIAASQINALKYSQCMLPDDIVNDRQLELHDIMYKEAVHGLKCEYNNIFKDGTEYVITELGDGTVSDAPFVSVSIINSTSDNTSTVPIRYLFSLKKWWPATVDTDTVHSTVIYSSNTGNGSNNKASKFSWPDDWTNCECTYIDYVNGKAEIKNKIYGWIRKISLKTLLYINKENVLIPMSEKMNKLKSSDSFSYLYTNKVVL